MKKNNKILVAGSSGMVGSSIVRALNLRGFNNLLTPNRGELDYFNKLKTRKFLRANKPDLIIIAAAKVGGVLANSEDRFDFIYNNLEIQNNIISSAHFEDVPNLVFLGSSCVYPKNFKIPIKEEYLLSNKLEETNEPYAIAKIAGIKLCQSIREQYGRNYFSVMPCNMYGPGDNYNLNSSHVLPALLKKIHLAKKNKNNEVILWGDGSPKREFLHVDDFSLALLKIIKNVKNKDLVNIGNGEEISIKHLSILIKNIVKFEGEIKFDKSMPNGVKRKVLDISILRSLNWKPKIKLEEGISKLYQQIKLSFKNEK
jgi:GDP-L-fucose synthase